MRLLPGWSKTIGLQNRCTTRAWVQANPLVLPPDGWMGRKLQQHRLFGEVLVRIRSNYALAVHSPSTTTNTCQSKESASEGLFPPFGTPKKNVENVLPILYRNSCSSLIST